jgi:hypothetical protein
MTVDGYVRVSRVGGRSGESLISPDEQRRAIEAYAAANSLTVAEWFTDVDQSGGTLERPEFQQALDAPRPRFWGGSFTTRDQRRGVGWRIELDERPTSLVNTD